MKHADNLTDLYLLVQVIDAGGFSAAARRLDTTRSLLSRRIIALEQRLEVRLIHRNARQFEVTAVGEKIYRQAVAMCEAAASAESIAVDSHDAPRGLLRVGSHALLSPLLAGVLPRFADLHPQIRLAMHPAAEGAGAVLRQRVDIHLGIGDDLPESYDLVARSLGSVRRVVVGNPALLERLGYPRHPDQVEDHDCLGFAAPGQPGEWTFHGAARQRRRFRMVTADSGMLLASVRAGSGLAQMPMYACEADLAEGRLRTVFDALEPPPLPMYALTMQGRATSEATLRFVRFLRGHLATHAGHGIVPADEEG